jgi:hypothetical protein
MALNPHFNATVRNAALDGIDTDLGTSAVFILYAGGQPANADTTISAGNVSVAVLEFSTTAFGAAAAGSMTANAIADDTSALGGTAAWFRLRVNATAGTTAVADGEVGTAGADLNLNAVTIATGATVSITSFTITMAA